MANLQSVDEILDFAIKNEEDAAQFYTELADKVKKQWMKKIFLEFAQEEKGHKAKLLAVKSGNLKMTFKDTVLDLKIGDYLVEGEASSDMDYQDALIIAMKAEKAAFKLYSDLAETTNDEELKQTLLALAQEEAKHKLRFELEYDDRILDPEWS